MNGNGNQFTVKEILTVHIKDSKIFEEYVRDNLDKFNSKFEDGSVKIATNKTKISSVTNVIKYGIAPLLFLVLGWLTKIQFMP